MFNVYQKKSDYYFEVPPGSLLDDRMHEDGFCDHHDHFVNTTPEAGWEDCLIHAEKIGLGTREYDLITVK